MRVKRFIALLAIGAAQVAMSTVPMGAVQAANLGADSVSSTMAPS